MNAADLVFLFGGILISVGANPVENDEIGSSYAPEQIHLSYTGDTTSMFVTWTSLVDVGNGSVTYWNYNSDDQKRVVLANKSQIVHTDDDVTNRTNFVYRAEMVGLDPKNKYQYEVQSGIYKSETHEFRNFPENDDFLPNIAVYGDMGVTNHVALPKVTQETEKGVLDMILHVGDIAYNMDEQLGVQGDMFMNLIQPVATRVPYNFLVGNHEKHNNFSEFSGRFTSPGPSVFYNSFNAGPIHFIMFSSEFYYYDKYGTGQLQSQYNWLVEDLPRANTPEARAKQPWIVTMAHRPMYCSNNDDHDCKNRDCVMRTGYKHKFYKLEDLFFNNSVDLQLFGHQHNYERALPIYNYHFEEPKNLSLYQDPKYPVHIITGAGGCREIHDKFEYPEPRWSVFRKNVYGFVYLKAVDRMTLNIKFYSVDDGQVIDEVTIAKTSAMPKFNTALLKKYEEF